jgi:glyoxylase-like metal-dependent hydrolase (beta-lactamase superfamily II)
MARVTLLLLLLLTTAQLHGQSEIVPGISLIRGAFTPGSQPDGNTVVLSAPDGLIVIDTGRHAAHTQRILDFATAQKQTIGSIVNTHWHLDHIGGNELVRKTFPDVHVYASAALTDARKGFLSRYRSQLEQLIPQTKDSEQQAAFRAEVALIDAAPRLAPDTVITRTAPMRIAGRTFVAGLETHAVTAGDVWLLDKERGVLVSGDLVTLPVPFLDTACPQRWNQTLERFSKMEFDLLIPGHGPALTHRQFDVYRTSFATLLACASGKAAKNECVEGWIAGVSALIPPGEQEFARNLMNYYVDVLRRPAAEIGPLCGG